MPGKKYYTGKGYIRKKHRGPKNVFDYLWSLTRNIYPYLDKTKDPEEQRKACHHFIAHLYVSMNYKYHKSDDPIEALMIPIYCRLIENEFKRLISGRVIKQLPYIEYIRHNRFQKLSTEYQLKPDVFEEAFRIDSDFVIDSWNNMLRTGKCSFNLVNLMKGNRIVSKKKHKKTVLKGTGLYDRNRDGLIKNSIDCFKPCPFNPEKIVKLVEVQKQVYEKAKVKLEKVEKKHGKESAQYNKAQTAKNRAQGIFYNDFTALRTILYQEPKFLSKRNSNALYEYNTAYEVQKSGRLTEITGGFQGASQPFKELFLPDSPELYNYDLKASQANFLIEEFNDNNISCQWLKVYLSGKHNKKYYADKVGIDVATWKECFYALVMGAHPFMTREIREEDTEKRIHEAIFESILKYFDRDEDKTFQAYSRFKRMTKEFLTDVRKWRDYLYEGKISKYVYEHGKVRYWGNSCGMKFKEYGIKKFFYPLFNSKDIHDRNDLIKKLMMGSDPISTFLSEKIPDLKKELHALEKKEGNGTLISYLNMLLDETGLYTNKRFKGTHLSEKSKAVLKDYRKLKKEDLRKINRLLIEDVFEGSVAKEAASKDRSCLISCENPNKPIIDIGDIHIINYLKRFLASFILQGQEACFIHHLTMLCKKINIPVYKNEHDGLIVGKKIPQKLVVVAARLAKTKSTPTLNIKPICSDAKRNKIIKHLGKERSSQIFSIKTL